VLSGIKIDPISFTSDFEVALLNAISEQFLKVARVGCAFHFKQALRHRMIEIRIASEEVRAAMRLEMIGSLRETPKDQMSKAIQDVRAHFSSSENHEKWHQFFEYFAQAWLNGNIPFGTWNITAHDNLCLPNLVATNDALENFNRQLNSSFFSPHPNIFRFIEVIRDISNTKLEEIKDIKERGG
jgi:hypothetical protein